jgi:septal ring factor EnvC (AmiA/AmiB activator)
MQPLAQIGTPSSVLVPSWGRRLVASIVPNWQKFSRFTQPIMIAIGIGTLFWFIKKKFVERLTKEQQELTQQNNTLQQQAARAQAAHEAAQKQMRALEQHIQNLTQELERSQKKAQELTQQNDVLRQQANPPHESNDRRTLLERLLRDMSQCANVCMKLSAPAPEIITEQKRNT